MSTIYSWSCLHLAKAGLYSALTKEGNAIKKATLALIVLLLVAAGIGGWYWHNHLRSSKSTQPYASTNKQQTSALPKNDPSEDGKYLVIKEWGVKFLVSSDLSGKLTYTMSQTVLDPQGNHIQQVKVFILSDNDPDNQCATTQIAQRYYIDSALQILRTEKLKPLDVARYRGTFKENIFRDSTYAYHLNYITPDCAGAGLTKQIMELQGEIKLQTA